MLRANRMLTPALTPFIQEAPFAVQASLVMAHLLHKPELQALFERERGLLYDDTLLFPELVTMMADVVLRFQPSAHAAYHKHKAKLGVSVQAVYGKLRRLTIPLVTALVALSARRARAVMDAAGQAEASWLPGYRVRVLDGNLLSATEARLDVLQQDWSPGLPGRLLVVMEQATRLVEHVVLSPDAYAQERSLLPELMPLIEPGDLWLADRNFCTLDWLQAVSEQKAAFIIRQHGTLKGTLCGERRFVAHTPQGDVYEQAIAFTKHGQTVRYRRITVELTTPTRDGDTELHLLSNLPATVLATTIATLYGRRWGIENLFREMDDNLNAEPGTLGVPVAALFCFCLGLVASNATQVLLGVLRAAQGAATVQTVSHYYIALEIIQITPGLRLACAEELAELGSLPLRSWLSLAKQIAASIPVKRYAKRPPNQAAPKRIPGAKNSKRPKKYRNGGHHSTHRELEAKKAQWSKPPPA